MKTYLIQAHWDAEAEVWWAKSDDVPGLVAETDTVEEMLNCLKRLVPELLALNESASGARDVAFKLVANRSEMLKLAAHA